MFGVPFAGSSTPSSPRRAPTFIPYATPALVNGQAGAVSARGSLLGVVVGFTVVDGRIAALDLIADPDKLRHVTVT